MAYQLINDDCLNFMKSMPDKSVDAVITDPPYPNTTGIFNNAIESARVFLKTYRCKHWLVFWSDDETPPVDLILSAKHYWIKTNGWQAGNKEAIYEFSLSQIQAREYRYPNVNTGVDAPPKGDIANHPTAKSIRLMKKIIVDSTNEGDTIFDPFMGSGTTGVAAIQLGRNFIGCEIDPDYFKIAEKRIKEAELQPQLFKQETPKPIQEDLWNSQK